MRKVFLGKPQSPGDFEARHKWLLRSVHEIEHASSERDPELDAIDKRLAAIEAKFADYTPTLTAEISCNPPSIAGHVFWTISVSVPGVLPGHIAAASFSIDTGDIVLTAYIATADSVEVNFINTTPGALDLGPGTLRVIVFMPPL